MTDTSTESVAGWLARLKAERDALQARAEAAEAKQEQARADALREAVKKIRNAPAWKFYSYAERDRVADVVEALIDIDKENDNG
jgi:3-dehydroquinate dehydratase